VLEIAHECNVEGCRCRRFRLVGGSQATRPLRRFNLVPQAPYLGMGEECEEPPRVDTSIPPTARPGARIESLTGRVRGGNEVATRRVEAAGESIGSRDAESA